MLTLFDLRDLTFTTGNKESPLNNCLFLPRRHGGTEKRKIFSSVSPCLRGKVFSLLDKIENVAVISGQFPRGDYEVSSH